MAVVGSGVRGRRSPARSVGKGPVRPGGEAAIDAILVRGNGPLKGEVPISGAKNAALPILTASILFDREIEVHNAPRLRDIDTLLQLLSVLGVKVRRKGRSLALDAADLSSYEAPYELVRQMRASIYVLGPLLARCGEARVSLPGGCAWGPRPVDLHILAMEQLGGAGHQVPVLHVDARP